MQLTTLLSLLPVLAALGADARTHHPNADIARRALHRGLTHERAAKEVADEISRREALAAANPNSVAKPERRTVKKRGAAGCRVRGQTFNTTSSAVTPAAQTSVSSSVAAVTSSSAGNANFAQGGVGPPFCIGGRSREVVIRC